MVGSRLTLKTVQGGAQETKGLISLILVSATSVAPAEPDASRDQVPDQACRGLDASTLVSNVILHSRLTIDAKLDLLVHGSTQRPMVLASIHVIGVVLGVVNMFLGAVAAKSLSSNFKFFGAKAKSHETEDTEEESDGFGRNGLDGTDVDGLGIVPQPVTKVDAGNVVLAELLATKGRRHSKL